MRERALPPIHLGCPGRDVLPRVREAASQGHRHQGLHQSALRKVRPGGQFVPVQKRRLQLVWHSADAESGRDRGGGESVTIYTAYLPDDQIEAMVEKSPKWPAFKQACVDLGLTPKQAIDMWVRIRTKHGLAIDLS